MIPEIFRSVPAFKGKQRLARLALSGYDLRAERVIEGHEFSLRVPNCVENIGFEVLINGSYEPETIAFICSNLPHNGLFLDIGANIGAILVPVCKRRPDVRTIGVEAAPWIFQYLTDNIKRNKILNAEAINLAIDTVPDRSVTFFSPKEKYGKGSMAPVFTDQGIAVTTTSLDRIVFGGSVVPSLIKADVEGFEYGAFLGGAGLLRRTDAPDILFEFVDWAESKAPGRSAGDAQELLLGYGYTLYFFEHGKPTRELTQPETKGAFMFFATKKKHR